MKQKRIKSDFTCLTEYIAVDKPLEQLALQILLHTVDAEINGPYAITIDYIVALARDHSRMLYQFIGECEDYDRSKLSQFEVWLFEIYCKTDEKDCFENCLIKLLTSFGIAPERLLIRIRDCQDIELIGIYVDELLITFDILVNP